MKKFIVGFIVGALLFSSGSAFSASIVKNYKGKIIQGQLPVLIDGRLIENPAIIIDGTSFLPVRQFAEKAGYKVSFSEDKKIFLEKNSTNLPSSTDDVGSQQNVNQTTAPQNTSAGSTPTGGTVPTNEAEDFDAEIKTLNAQVDKIEVEINNLNEKMKNTDSTYKTTQAYQDDLKALEKFQQDEEKLIIQIAQLAKEKAESLSE